MSLLDTHAVTIQTGTDNSQGPTTWASVAVDEPCSRQEMTPGLAFEKWQIELNSPVRFMFDGLAKRDNIKPGKTRFVDARGTYRVEAVKVRDSGVVDHIDCVANQEQT